AAKSTGAAINSRRMEGKRGSLSKVTGGPTTDSGSRDHQGRPALLERPGVSRYLNVLALRIGQNPKGVGSRPAGPIPGAHVRPHSVDELGLRAETDDRKWQQPLAISDRVGRRTRERDQPLLA